MITNSHEIVSWELQNLNYVHTELSKPNIIPSLLECFIFDNKEEISP